MPRSPFDALADDYDAARPSYPRALYDDLEALAGPLRGARVCEVGAGTGIATRALQDRGANVLAVDLGAAMLARLRARAGAAPAAVADAHALPLPGSSVDLVCVAQAWHWVCVDAAAAEVARVLRPGGSLAVWWNDIDAEGEPWWEAQQRRLEAGSPGYRRDYRGRDYGEELRHSGLFASVVSAQSGWVRSLDLDTYAAWLRSKSYVAAMGPAMAGFLAAERRSLAEAFPDGEVREPFVTRLWVARAPAEASSDPA